MICIENDGVAEALGMRLMGASSKDHTQIGRFGTGWKYGIAGALRLGGPFVITLGDAVVHVGSKEVTLRGATHREVTLDGEPIGITDQLGKDWEPWMVMREFVSNAVDEGGAKVYATGAVVPVPTKTRVYLPDQPFASVAIEDYFCLEPVPGEVVTPLGRAIPKQDPNEVRIYKKGVVVKRVREKSAYDYELNDVPIGEDRLAGDVRSSLWAFLDGAPLEVKRQAIRYRFESESYMWGQPSPTWLDAFDGKLVTYHSDRIHPDALVVPYNFVEVANRVGARTLKNDKAAKAAQRQTMPASYTAKEVIKRMKRIVTVDPRVVVMAKIKEDYLVEDGVVHLRDDLNEQELFDALLLAATHGRYDGDPDQLKALVEIVRRLAKF